MIASYRTRPGNGRRSLGFLIVCLLLGASPGVFGATLTVSTLLDTDDPAAAGECTLREAIENANDNADTNTNCTPNGAYGDDLIQFDSSLFAEVDDKPNVDDDGRHLELTERTELLISDAGGTGTLTIDGEIANPEDAEDTVTVTVDALGSGVGSSNFVCGVDEEDPITPIRIFNVRSATTLNSLNLTGGCTPDGDPQGGAILVGNNAPLTLNDVDITNSLALDDTSETGAGGGIFVASGSTLTMTGGSLRANTAGTTGGAIANDSDATIDGGCPLAADSAFFSGACTISLEDVRIAGNIVGDSATDRTIFGSGGGLHNGTAATIAGRGVTFDGNVASISGGGIWTSATGSVELLSATLQNNRARALDQTETGIMGGAAIFNDGGTLTIEFATFRSNGVLRGDVLDTEAVTVHGGAIASTGGDLLFDTVAMTGNAAGQREVQNNDDEVIQQLIPGLGGALYVETGSLTIRDSTLFSNLAQTDGGGIWNATGNLDMQRVTVQSNEAHGGDEDPAVITGGGGLYNEGSATIVDSRFYSNLANGENGAGGGILHVSGTLEVSGTEIGRNDATFGGGIDNGGSLDLSQVFLGAPQIESRNIAGDDGGGLRNRGDATFVDSTIAYNDGADGGGIWNDGSLTVTNSTFANNRALGDDDSKGDGGALFQADNGTTTLSFVTLAGNSAEGDGGDVAKAEAAAAVEVTDSIVAKAAMDSVNASRSLVNESGLELDALELFGGPLPTRPLRVDSPAVDFVADTDCTLADDQRGATRPADGDTDGTADCDAGSFERTDDPVLKVGRNGPQEVRFELGQDLAVLAFSLTNDSETSVNVDGFNVRPLFNGGVEALRRLVLNDPDETDLVFEVVLDNGAGGNAGNGRLDDDETTVVGDGDGRTFDCTGVQCSIDANGGSEDFLIVVRVPEQAEETAAAGAFSAPPIVAGGLLIGLLGLVRLRGVRRRVQWLLVVAMLTGGLAACSDSTSIDDIEPPRRPQADPSLQGQLRFKLVELTNSTVDEIVVGDGLPVYGPAIGVP